MGTITAYRSHVRLTYHAHGDTLKHKSPTPQACAATILTGPGERANERDPSGSLRVLGLRTPKEKPYRPSKSRTAWTGFFSFSSSQIWLVPWFARLTCVRIQDQQEKNSPGRSCYSFPS